MNGLCRPVNWVLLPFILVTRFPYTFWNIFIWHFIKNSITSQQYEVMILVDYKLPYLWLCFDHIHVATSIRQFGFWITKSPRHRKTPRQYSNWSYYVFGLILSCFFFPISTCFLTLIQRFWVVFDALCSSSLVDLSAISDNPLVLLHIWRLMISA